MLRIIIRPVIQAPPAFKEAPPAGSGNWTVAQPADEKIRGDWWAIFNDPELNDLEAKLNIDNQNLKVYFENFLEARALVREARAAVFSHRERRPVVQPVAFLRQPEQQRDGEYW